MQREELILRIVRSIVVVVICILATVANSIGHTNISGDALIALYSSSLGYLFGVAASGTTIGYPERRNGGGNGKTVA